MDKVTEEEKTAAADKKTALIVKLYWYILVFLVLIIAGSVYLSSEDNKVLSLERKAGDIQLLYPAGLEDENINTDGSNLKKASVVMLNAKESLLAEQFGLGCRDSVVRCQKLIRRAVSNKKLGNLLRNVSIKNRYIGLGYEFDYSPSVYVDVRATDSKIIKFLKEIIPRQFTNEEEKWLRFLGFNFSCDLKNSPECKDLISKAQKNLRLAYAIIENSVAIRKRFETYNKPSLINFIPSDRSYVNRYGEVEINHAAKDELIISFLESVNKEALSKKELKFAKEFGLSCSFYDLDCRDLIRRATANKNLGDAFRKVSARNIWIIPKSHFEVDRGYLTINVKSSDEDIIKFINN